MRAYWVSGLYLSKAGIEFLQASEEKSVYLELGEWIEHDGVLGAMPKEWQLPYVMLHLADNEQQALDVASENVTHEGEYMWVEGPRAAAATECEFMRAMGAPSLFSLHNGAL